MKDFRVHQVVLNHIGAFEHLTLSFKEKIDKTKADIHIFTGENGTGKSTILQAIAGITNQKLLTPKVHVEFTVEPYSLIQFVVIDESPPPHQGDMAFHEMWKITFSNGRWLQERNKNSNIYKYFQKWESYQFERFDFALFAYSSYRKVDHVNIGYIREVAQSPLDLSLDLSSSISPEILLQWVANTKTKEALAYRKGDSQKTIQYQDAIQRIERIISEITEWHIEFVLTDDPLSVLISVNGVVMDFGILPDGLKSIISWIADLLMRMDRLKWNNHLDVFHQNFVLLLDELEVHLHPAWQRKILPIIQNLFPNAQILVSTHSPFVTNSVDNAWIYKLKKVGNYSVLDGEPVRSENGKSYRTILEEIFGITRQFGYEVEEDLDNFYRMKDEIIAKKRELKNEEFQSLATSLSIQSIELENIIGMELYQLQKLLMNNSAQ